jgi:WD40 repeat protein
MRASSSVQNRNLIGNLIDPEIEPLSHPSLITAMAWSPDGNHLATASENRDLHLWDLRIPGKDRRFMQAHSEAVIDLAFNSSGDLLASMGADRVLKLWTTATGRHATYPVESDISGRLRFSQDGQRLGYAGVKSGIQIWKVLGVDHYRVFRALGEVRAPFASICFGPDGRLIVAANDLGVFFWDAAAGREFPYLKLRPTRLAMMHPDTGDLLASTPFGFYRWPRRTLRDGNALSFQFGPSECFDLPALLGRCTWGAGSGQVAVIHENHIHLANTEAPPSNIKLPSKGPFDAITTSSNGKWLATWTKDANRLAIWALKSLGEDATPVKVMLGLQQFTFCPDGRFLVTCSSWEHQLWDTETWQNQKLTFSASESGESHCVAAFARAGSRGETMLALANSSTTIKLLRISPGSPASFLELATLQSPDPRPLIELAFNRDGSRLAAAAADQTVQVWNLATIREELTRMKLQGDLPTFSAKSEGPLTVTLKSDTLDKETPRKWQEVEDLTVALAGATNSATRSVLMNFQKRGQLYLDLRRPLDAQRDFEEALSLSPEDPILLELLRKARAALKSDENPDSGEKQGKGIHDKPAGRIVPTN